MGSREDALRSLEDRDWSGAEVEHTPRSAMIVHSIRLPEDASRWVEAEAVRQGTNPSVVIRGLVERAARPQPSGETVVVRVDELRRNVLQAVEQAIHPAA
ncbi:hypothetical protein ACFP2T_43270 [Plantactinospora solaniradicis]|uniref:CopG family transcriptional regulator n=1 Tax=Plantactinospora solaniradicis TaxID=1723736 RepID=A0ABW1KMX9_9ACTN